MTKIMLVEDDNNLREIYEARLLAEGYEIVSAKDGEEALATAVKEKPDLIISDVMMPKISGFDMLDILRSTPETKNTKVIMMTALSQAEDKARADKLGADKYLVKSQVTLEDVARVAAEVISGEATPGIDSVEPVAPTPTPTPIAEPAIIPAVAPEPIATPIPAAPIPAAPIESPTPVVPTNPIISTEPVVIDATSTSKELADIQNQIDSFANQPVDTTAEPVTVTADPPQTPATLPTEAQVTATDNTDQVAVPTAAAPEPIIVNDIPVATTAETPAPQPTSTVVINDESAPEAEGASSSKRVIQPINDLSNPGKNLTELAAQEDAIEAAKSPTVSLPPANDQVAPAPDTVISPTGTDTTAL